MRTYAQEVRKTFEEQLRAAPNDAQRHVGLGLALAYLGRISESDVIDWTITSPDGREEGNFIGKFLDSTKR